MPAAAPRVRLEPIANDDVPRAAELWRQVSNESDDPHYALTPEWLGAWAAVTAPRSLALVRVGDDAIGLLERRRLGRWSFAGGPVSPERRLLCRRGTERAAWAALWTWAATATGSTELEAIGLPVGVPVPERAVLTRQSSFGAALPGTFERWMAERSPGSRKGLKSKLRRLEREGAVVVPVDRREQRAALGRFVDLHQRRAAVKAERHPHVDERLVALLDDLPDDGDVRLRLFELRAAGTVAGVTVRLDHQGTGYFYNAGIDPEFSSLSPGVALEMHSIADAIDRGLRAFDFGPGDYRYKRDLGGVAEQRFRAVVPRRSLGGLAVVAARSLRLRVRG